MLTGLIQFVVADGIYLSVFNMIYHNGMQSTKQNIVNMKRTGQQVEGCGILKLRLTERIFEKKSHKILEPMFDHGTTRI